MAYLKNNINVTNAKAIVKSDTANITDTSGEIQGGCLVYVGVGGHVKALTATGNEVTFLNVPSGTVLPVQCVRVFSAVTTATDMVALW